MSVLAGTWSTEQIVDDAIGLLSAGLGPALTAIYAAQADVDVAAGRTIDYTVPRPGLAEQGGDYYPDAASTILRYPAVEVSVPDLAMSNFDLALLDADVTENLIVLAWEQGTQIEHLARKLRRLVAAIFNVLVTPTTSLADGNIQSVRAAWRWNPEAQERDEIVSGGLLVLGLASTRSRP